MDHDNRHDDIPGEELPPAPAGRSSRGRLLLVSIAALAVIGIFGAGLLLPLSYQMNPMPVPVKTPTLSIKPEPTVTATRPQATRTPLQGTPTDSSISATVSPSSPVSTLPSTGGEPTTIVTHTVRPGETLASIAAMYDVALRPLLDINHLTNSPAQISVGQSLTIPLEVLATIQPSLPPTPTPTLSPDQIVSAAFDQLQPGSIGYDPPGIMRAGSTHDIVVAITWNTDETAVGLVVGAIQQEASTGDNPTPAPEDIKIQAIDVNSKMRARLIPDNTDDFYIVAITPAEQIIDRQEATTWQWRVTPLRAGKGKVLTLNVDAIVKVVLPGTNQPLEEERSVRVLHEQIDVDVSLAYSSRLLWDQYWWSALIAILPLLATWFARRRGISLPVGRRRALTKEQRQELLAALLSAYPSEADLARMTQLGLDQNLATITIGDDLTDMALELINWAESTGQVKALVAAATRNNPTNPEIKAFAAQYLGAQPTTTTQERNP
ncbi:MAG: LysM peptidoglycan-binding domain-containing protein [Planctomycetales bacterium]|nr:LysM peptidoglycan-binding domain-containing protein [Planctomycetales bacterium]